jgi:hypothetical protein
MNYFELNLLGKKIGLSILALNLLITETQPEQNWLLFFNIVVGAVCGIVGNILPWARVACDEFETRAMFCSESISAVLKDLVVAWRYASVPVTLNKNIPRQSSAVLFDDMFQFQWVDHHVRLEHRCWRLLRNVLLAVAAFRQHKSTSWSSRYSHHKNNVHMRVELVRYISEVLDYMQVLNADARFGPARSRAIVRYHHYLAMVKDLILVIEILERRLRDIRHQPQIHHILFAFQNLPEFRAAVSKFVACVADTIVEAGHWLHTPSNLVPDDALTAISRLDKARDALDEAYIRARITIYYHDDPSRRKAMNSFVAMNQNSFLLLFDSAHLVVTRFWTTFTLTSPQRWETSTHAYWMAQTSMMLNSIRSDLFPSQKHLFTLDKGRPSAAMLARLKQSLSLSLAMTIAGVYGYFASRPQIFMAAFTIAYLSGGAVSNANAMTSGNRATGTVAGSVYAVIVEVIVEDWDVVRRNVFIFFAVVLFQLPCTYIRTLPLYGYAGTVAAFTASILLLMPSFDQQQVRQLLLLLLLRLTLWLRQWIELSTHMWACSSSY